jgi:hypothetical protein
MPTELTRRLHSPSHPGLTWTSTLVISEDGNVTLRLKVNDMISEANEFNGLRGTMIAVMAGIYLCERRLVESMPDLIDDQGFLVVDTLAYLDASTWT